jgi:hypothetical protein
MMLSLEPLQFYVGAFSPVNLVLRQPKFERAATGMLKFQPLEFDGDVSLRLLEAQEGPKDLKDFTRTPAVSSPPPAADVSAVLVDPFLEAQAATQDGHHDLKCLNSDLRNLDVQFVSHMAPDCDGSFVEPLPDDDAAFSVEEPSTVGESLSSGHVFTIHLASHRNNEGGR